MTLTRIIGTGSYVPEQIVSNREVGDPVGVEAALVHRLTGISERRWAPPTQAPSDLAAEAGRQALATAGLVAADLDGIVVSFSDCLPVGMCRPSTSRLRAQDSSMDSQWRMP